MNQKANKYKIEWPPLLQMMNDHPVIDDSFRNVEKLNAPYLNDMLSPYWIKNLEQKAVFDASGHSYTIEDSYLTKDGVNLFEVDNKKFTKYDITEELAKYDAYDENDNHKATAIWNGDENYYTLTFDDNEFNTDILYDEGVVIASRIRVIDNAAYFIAYYDISDLPYLYIARIDNELSQIYNNKVYWRSQIVKRTASDTTNWQIKAIDNADPVIQIGKVTEDVIGISLVSSRNKALDTYTNGFITCFIKDNDIKFVGDDILPKSQTSSITVTYRYDANFKIKVNRNSESIKGSCISSDDITYYEYTEVGKIGDDLNIPTSYTPESTGNSIEIDGVTYNIYDYTSTRYNYSITLTTDRDDLNVVVVDFNDNEYELSQSNDTASFDTIAYRGDEVYTAYSAWKSVTANFHESILEVESSKWNNKVNTVHAEWSALVNAGWLTSPNVVIDSGELFSFYTLPKSYTAGNNWSDQYLQVGSIIEESGYIKEIDWDGNYEITPTEFVQLTSDYNVLRSNSIVFLQNFFTSTVKLNNTSSTSSYTRWNNGNTAGNESTSSKYLEYNNSNASDKRFYPGTTFDTTFNYFGAIYFNIPQDGNSEDCLIYTAQGYRVPVKSADRYLLGSSPSKFNLCYNVQSSNVASVLGISYSNSESEMGTLLTSWTSIDEDYYISAGSDFVIYRDKSNRIWRIQVEEGNELSALLDDRYILVNTTSYWNMYDSVLMKKFHYASDYNDRLLFGSTSVPTTILAGANSSGTISYTRYTATAVNALYTIKPYYAVSSLLRAYEIRIRIGINVEKAFNCLVPESKDVQPIDVYYSGVGTDTTLSYRYSFYPYKNYDKKINFDLVDTVYNISTTYLNSNIFTQYINGQGVNDFAQEDDSIYSLLTYDGVPHFLYSLSSATTSYNNQMSFFVIQGQFYAFMNEKIYSIIYSNGTITSQEAIIDCRGMKFIGNNPQIAFFFSVVNHSIYSFTGDAILQHLWNANKFSQMNDYWYDESTQSIYISTDIGLLVIGNKNTYLLDFPNVTNVQISNDGVTHVTSDDVTYNLRYYYEEGYEVLPIDLETSFYGLGNNEYTSIDRWDIVLYDNTGKKENSYITAGVRSITDVTVKSEEKLFKITPDMYDKWSDSILIRYVPKLQKGQGIRLYVKTPLIIQRIVPHIADMNTGTLTKRGM